MPYILYRDYFYIHRIGNQKTLGEYCYCGVFVYFLVWLIIHLFWVIFGGGGGGGRVFWSLQPFYPKFGSVKVT